MEGVNFDNEIVIQQFERNFKPLEVKTNFAGQDFEIIVENAWIHYSQEYSLFMFGIKPGCPVEQIRCIAKDNIEIKL